MRLHLHRLRKMAQAMGRALEYEAEFIHEVIAAIIRTESRHQKTEDKIKPIRKVTVIDKQ